jgi:hypothetical protein
MIEHRAEIAHVEKPAARFAFEKMLGLAQRPVPPTICNRLPLAAGYFHLPGLDPSQLFGPLLGIAFLFST